MLVLLTAVLTATATPVPPPLPPQPMSYAPRVDAPIVVPVPDPARLAVATRIAARLLPDGSYRSMMGSLMDNMQQSMIAQMTTLPVRELAKAGGLPDAKVAAIGPATLRDVLAIMDPNFDERIRLVSTTMTRGLIDTMSNMEPTMREGLAVAYANNFTAAQLADIEAFFASPTGSLYAGKNLQMVNDPAFQSRMRGMMKTMTAQLPTILGKAQAATASLPKPRTYADLTPADKAKLARLLGVDPATLK